MFEIIPGILEKNWAEIEKKLELCIGFASTVHVDFIDGKFAPDATFLDPQPFKKYATRFTLEAHLMVEDPTSYLQKLCDSGFIRIYSQIESLKSQEQQQEFVEKGQLLADVGFALDLNTSLSSVKVPFEDLDGLLLMGVKAGYSGQSFADSTLVKMQEITEQTFLPIEVDGGVNDSNITQLRNAGATSVVSNSFLFNGNPKDQFEKLEKLS